MQIKNFFNSRAKTFLVLGALSVSAFVGADGYTNSTIHYDNNHHFDNNHFDNCGAPSGAPACETSCCGTPCNAAPDYAWTYNPPAYASCGSDAACCGGFFESFAFRADFLWWRACEEGLELGTEEFVSTFSSEGSTSDTVINRSHSKEPKFKYDPGFRIGFGTKTCDCWDFAVNWTHFHSKSNVNGAAVEANGTTFSSGFERVVGANPERVQGRYSLNLDLVDIEFGRKFYVSSCFVLRPEFGLRVARINQNYRLSLESGQGTDVCPGYYFEYCDSFTDFVSDVKARSNFLSVGPRIGLDIELHLGCGVTLFGQAAGSVVFGEFDNSSREDFANNACDAFIGSYNYNSHSPAHRCSRTITDMAFGFKWDRCYELCGRSHPVGLAFAWEHHAFYNMNNFDFSSRGFNTCGSNLVDGNKAKGGNLFTQGLTVSLSFGF